MAAMATHIHEPVLTAAERASLGALSNIVARIEQTVDAETEALRQHRPIDIAAVNHRKRQGLLELSLVVPQISTAVLKGAARERLTQLARKLEQNRDALDIQLRAVREVAEIIATMIREAESDGTYSMVPERR